MPKWKNKISYTTLNIKRTVLTHEKLVRKIWISPFMESSDGGISCIIPMHMGIFIHSFII